MRQKAPRQRGTKAPNRDREGAATLDLGPGTLDSPRTCELCGGPLRSDNRWGVCCRTPRCEKEARRRSRQARREHIAEYHRRYYRANRKRYLAYGRRRCQVNREKLLAYARRYRYANREKLRLGKMAYSLKRGRAITGLPKDRLCGDRNPAWCGGRFCFCDFCGEFIGWRSPSAILPNGTYCQKHASSWRKRKEAHHGPQQAKAAS